MSAVRPVRTVVVAQGRTTVRFDGTLPLTFTPERDGSILLSQGDVRSTLPTSAPISVGYKGAWPVEPPPPPPPDFTWQAPRSTVGMTPPPKPAKGGSFVNAYGLTVTRITDHASDPVNPPNPVWLREDYSRRQSLNADDTLLLVYSPSGFWNVFDAHTGAFVKRLAGPAADAEIQWDPTDSDILYYVPTNGGKVLYRHHVSSNTSEVQYDFGADVTALFGSSVFHCWTKSEGSPSGDGRLWGLMCETSGFAPLGYVVLDIFARTVVWSMPNSIRPDNVTMSPCGRWFVEGGNTTRGTRAYKIDGSAERQLLDHVEHVDIGLRPNGNSFYIVCDYTAAGGGAVFAIDLETGERIDLFNDYNNPWIGTDYALHFSAKAFRAPGWVVIGAYQGSDNVANMFLTNIETRQTYGLGVNFVADTDYWDEPHAFASRDLKRVYYNDNWQQGLSGDVYRIDVPALPTSRVEPARPKTYLEIEQAGSSRLKRSTRVNPRVAQIEGTA